jgi:MFS transporter, PPP family, 3-phenylpropionic acid transporter
VVGRLADRAQDWRQTIVIGATLAAIIPFGLFFSSGFLPILLVWTLAAVAPSVVGPVMDAATMRLTLRRGSDFGRLRAWGTVGYMVTILATGYLVTLFGAVAFVPLFVGLAVLRGLAALGLPKFRRPLDLGREDRGATRLMQVMKPWFLAPLVGWAMVFGTLLILNAFQGLLWARQGLQPDLIAILIGLGAFSEAVAFFAFRRFASHYPARVLMLVSALVAMLRWCIMAYAPGVPVLVGLQLLHGICFSMGFLGCLRFIANWTSEDIAAEAQGFFNMLQQAMAVVAIMGFGWLTTRFGPLAYLGSAGFAAVGAGLIWASLRMQQPRG